ncbi:MAG: NfeD family protein [Bacteroidales bacterium]|nr:NfeD family protein [Bacteroidales bacterium]
MSWIIILILITLGIIFILLELLVIPGTTFVGIIGIVALAFGVYEIFILYGNTWGIISLVGTSLFSIVTLVMALRSNTWNKAMLSTSIDSKISQQVENITVGSTGVTISRLTPMGKARFGDDFVEVSTFGAFVDPGKEVQVVEIENNKIFVEIIEK